MELASNTASTWSQLEKMILAKVNSALNQEVAQQVKSEIRTAVDEKIYQSGDPVIYQRRGLINGSLGDPNEMNHDINISGSDISLEVWDEAKSKMPWDRDLTEAMIHGYGSKDQWFNEERDFLETARENMKEDKSHVEALKSGLHRNGIQVL